MKSTNWHVITGGPSSGKTTTVNLLRDRGYHTTVELARHYIDVMRVAGKSVAEIRANQRIFQHAVLDMQIEQEKALAPDDLVFLDRALPDELAYYRFLHLPMEPKLSDALAAASYRSVFILAPLKLAPDYARTEDEAAQREIHRLIVEVYEALPFPVVRVPVLPAEQRVEMILDHVLARAK
jgi:predicted ATPase